MLKLPFLGLGLLLTIAPALAAVHRPVPPPEVKRELHRRMIERSKHAGLLSEIGEEDRAEDLVDGGAAGLLTTLEEMETQKLLSAELPENPWSDIYWPTYQGMAAARYSAPGFPSYNKDWKTYFDFSQTACSPDDLSPAEKYDLLVDDAQKTLTHANWAEGKELYDQYGSVEDWEGICDGWTAASIMVPRPAHKVTLNYQNAQGAPVSLTFYPSDIKALLDLLWARAAPEVRFIGRRCETKNPPADGSGHTQDPACLDTNPGTWHKAVVNQIGVQKRGFIMDATYDYEIWNQPVYSYRYNYFNPATLQDVTSLADARVPLAGFTQDRFKAYRSPSASSVVGIAMTVTYMNESSASHRDTDSNSYDAFTNAYYRYDLELDAQGKIVGGEWYALSHPDFLWVPPKDSKPLTVVNGHVHGGWNGTGRVPESWKKNAKTASASNQPLPQLVDLLVKLSKLGI
ncbi:MAG: hypothetical protein ACXWPM_07060 [Bdellovibrionota bacterium]